MQMRAGVGRMRVKVDRSSVILRHDGLGGTNPFGA
jgi:hypothetical protein